MIDLTESGRVIRLQKLETLQATRKLLNGFCKFDFLSIANNTGDFNSTDMKHDRMIN